ncbi:MAG: hypothetical protein FWD16_01400, partial [Clostridia bacterium]|nr:hypothetical protein [Clostridia bacterium]
MGFLALVCAVSFLVSLALRLSARPVRNVALVRGSINVGRMEYGVAVREETVLYKARVGSVQYLTLEGQAVETGAPLLRVYSLGYSQKLLDDVFEVRQKIYDYQLTESRDPLDLALRTRQEEIELLRKNLATALRQGNTAAVSQYERKLIAALQERRAYLSEQHKENGYLKALADQEQQKLQLVTDYTADVEADKAGVVSFGFDGHEEVLSPGSVQDMTYAQLLENLAVDNLETMRSQGYTPLFRLVQTDMWMFVCMAKSATDYIQGQIYEIVFEGYRDELFFGKFKGSRGEGRQHLLYFEIDQPPRGLLSQREMNANIGQHFTGLMAPNSAVVKKRGKTGIWVLGEDKRSFVPVTVLAKDRNDCIIEASEFGDVKLEEGTRVEAR